MSYEEMQEAEDEMFMLYCQERCPALYSVLIEDQDENAERMLDVANRTLAEDEGIRAKMLAYQEAASGLARREVRRLPDGPKSSHANWIRKLS